MDAAALRREHDKGITAANRKLYNAEALADVTVTIGDVAFPCHKALLPAWSGYFRSMFSSDFTERQASHVTLPESHIVSPKAFSVLHEWMYLGKLSLSLETAEVILPTAFYLQMDKTVDLLIDYMRYQYSWCVPRHVSTSRMFDHLSLAHSCGIPAVRVIAVKEMAIRFDEVVGIEDFLALKAEDLLGLIRVRMDGLTARSKDSVVSVVRAAFAWLHHSADRLTYLRDIVKSLRVGLVSAETIRKALDTMSIDSNCCDILRDVLAAVESDKKSLEQLQKDHSKMFKDRTTSPLGKTRVRYITHADINELYSDIWRDAYVTLGDTCRDSTDVTVTVDGEAFHCHKAVLFGWSGYFERRFLHGEGSARYDGSPTAETQDVPRSYEDDLQPGSECEAPPGVGEHGAPSQETETGPSTRAEKCGVDLDSRDSLSVQDELLRPSPAQAYEQHQESSDMKHVSLSGGNMTKTAFSVVLDWIYRGECKVTAKNVCDVIMCARCLQMDRVLSFVGKYFDRTLSASVGEEIMTVFHTAKNYSAKAVYESCVNQIVRHFEELSDSEEFIWLLDVDTFLRILQDDRLEVRDENTVFKLALSWLGYSESNLAHTGDVIKSCRLGLVETDILDDGLEVVSLSRDLDAFNLLRQMMKKAPGSLDSLRKDRPAMFRRRRNKAFYESLRETFSMGEIQGAGRLFSPTSVCVLGDLVLVAYILGDRLVAFRRPEPGAKHSYVSHVDIKRPFCCVSDKATDTIYVYCSEYPIIKIVKWTQSEGLRVLKWQVVCVGESDHMALDPRDKEHMYVPCEEGVRKVSLRTCTVVTTLSHPSGLTDCLSSRVAIIGSTLMVSYEWNKALVLYAEGETSGHVIRPTGLKEPVGLGEDGMNFLVGDAVDKCIYVISPNGETLTTVNTGNSAPYNITGDGETVYITTGRDDVRVHVLQ